MAATEVVGYGNNANQNVLGIAFDYDLSSLVKYEAYDNDNTFPAIDSSNTGVTHECFSRSSHASGSIICLTDTSNAAPDSDWHSDIPADTSESNPNRLKGTSYYVEQDGSILSGGTDGVYDTNATNNKRARFNMVIDVPSTCQTSDDMAFDLAVRYTYTGTAPTPKFQYNTGTEGSPTWTDATAGSEGLIHCRASSSVGNLYANIPESGTELTAEGFISTSLTGS